MFEIDYMPVGTGSRGGDAIALRYGDFSSRETYKVVIIDGGTKESGKALVEHVKTHYETTHVDVVVASHLHNDHVSGLTEVFSGLTVEKLIAHLPWNYTTSLKRMTTTQSTAENLGTKLEKSLCTLSSVIDLAEEKGVTIVQPFAGEKILDDLYVLGPTKNYYESLLANFGGTPEVKPIHKIEEMFISIKDAIVNWLDETLDVETLSDDHPDTSPENNSSFVLLLAVDGKRFLFTGDAGKEALTKSIDFAESNSLSLSKVDFFDVPHHGSKRNLGPTVLDRLMPRKAFISCPPEGDPKHPSRKVINALCRRCESDPGSTRKGGAICHFSSGAPASQREGWGRLEPETFNPKVEE